MSHLLLLMSLIGTNAKISVPTVSSQLIPYGILDNFQNYTTIYHYNNKTKVNLTVSTERPAILLNYDGEIFARPPARQYFHLIYLDDIGKFIKYSTITSNLIYFDVVMFVIYQDFRSIQMDGLNSAGGIFFYNVLTDFLYTICYYCAENSGKLQKVADVDNLKKYLNTFWNLHGHRLAIVYGDYPPFFQYLERKYTVGFEANMLAAVNKSLNFTFDLEAPSQSFEGTLWQRMIKAVETKEAELAISGISVTEKRLETTDFSRNFVTDSYRVLFSINTDPWLKVKKTIFILQWPVILCIVLSVLTITLFSRITKGAQTTYYYLHAATGTLMDQPLSNSTFISSGPYNIRILFILWWLLIVCITTYYRSKWASLLTTPNVNLPRDIDELVARDYKFLIKQREWSLLREQLLTSPNPIYKKVLENIVDNSGNCKEISFLSNHRGAMFDEASGLQYKLYKLCRDNLTDIEKSKLRFLPDHLFSGRFHGWCLQKSAPFERALSAVLARLDSAGLINYWYNNELEKNSYYTQSGKQFMSLGVLDILTPFMILLIGLALSMIALVGEIFVLKFKRKSKLFGDIQVVGSGES